MSSPFVRLLSSCLLAVACLVATPAYAASTQASACADVFGACVTNDGVEVAYATNSGYGAYPDRTFSSMAEAAMGALRAQVTASAEDFGGQSPRATAKFDDDVQVFSPLGVSQFQVTVTISLDGACEDNCSAQLFAHVGRGLNFVDLDLLTFPDRLSATLTLRPGDDLPISSYLDVRCGIKFGTCIGDFAHTGKLSLSSSTPGVTFIGETGHNYAPVPEPETWLLGVVGIAVLWIWRVISVGRGR